MVWIRPLTIKRLVKIHSIMNKETNPSSPEEKETQKITASAIRDFIEQGK